MARKLTIDQVQEKYRKRGYEFLDREYFGTLHKNNIRCKKGHIFKQSYASFQGCKEGCPECAGNNRPTLEKIKKDYEERGFLFLDSEYKGNKYRHNVKCHCGSIVKKTYNALFRSSGCINCSGVKKHTLNEVREILASIGYQFLDSQYEGTGTPHTIKCPNGHISKMTLNNLKNGHTCKECAKKQREETCLVKYGTTNPLGNILIREKKNQTILDKYGTVIPLRNKDIQQKQKKTCLERYGVEYISQNREIALKQAKKLNKSELHYHWLTGEEIWTQGSYEPAVIYYLTVNKINYLWQPEVIKLSTGKTYRPDLYLVEEDKWIEIKGYFRKDALEKWEEFHNKIKTNSELWDKEKLKSLSIL
jgi:hypothetical protein